MVSRIDSLISKCRWWDVMSDIEKLKQDIIQKFGTPCAVIDLDIVEGNIEYLQALCDNVKLANRPHIKTHKSPLLALRQLAAGAIGITCQNWAKQRLWRGLASKTY